MVSEIMDKFEKKEFLNLTDKFKFIGSDINIAYPFRISGYSYISIGNEFRALEHLRLEAIAYYAEEAFNPIISIGNNVSVESNCHIGAIDKIIIEDGVMIASNVYISDHFHGSITKDELVMPPAARKLSSKGPIIIKKNVWIGDSVCILSGVIVGENAIIGANSVVTKDIPANSVVAGVPARVIRQL